MEKDKLIVVGKLYEQLNELAGAELPLLEIYRSKGLPSHLLKRKHYSCLKHIDDIGDIIESPDYVGVNPNEKKDSIELIKQFDKNILIGIKFDIEGEYLYVSTMYEVQQSKIDRRVHSGRLKIVVDKTEGK